MVNTELIALLNQKSEDFMMGGYNHSYNHLEKIFFLKGPID